MLPRLFLASVSSAELTEQLAAYELDDEDEEARAAARRDAGRG